MNLTVRLLWIRGCFSTLSHGCSHTGGVMSDQNDSRYKERSCGRMMGMWERKNKKQTSSALSLSLYSPFREKNFWFVGVFWVLVSRNIRGSVSLSGSQKKKRIPEKNPFFLV